MGEVVDLKEKFKEYFNEVEGFSLRSERFFEDLRAADNEALAERMTAWLEAAFMQGAKAMAQDTLDTLLDYGTATAGLQEPKRNPTECYDAAHEALLHYFMYEVGLVKPDKTKV